MNGEIFFLPFVGSQYASGGMFGKRIMVLGESHYCNEGCADCGSCLPHRECMNFTKGVVESYLDNSNGRERWMQTFLKFERSLVGMETDPIQRQRIWQSVMYYYLQVAMGGPREAETAAQYSQACEAFFEVMDQYQPQYIIAWGKRLWDKLPSEHWTDGTEITVDGYRVPTGNYILKSGMRVKAMAVNHPSFGYSWDYWHKVITAFFK